MTPVTESHRSVDPPIPGLTGGHVVVSGGAGGIGRSVARELLGANCDVLLLDRHEDDIHTALEELKKTGPGRIAGVSADVTNSMSVESAVQHGISKFGPLTGVVAGAGIRVSPAQFPDVSDEEFQQQLAVNASGVFHVCRSVAAAMRSNETQGSIVTIASISGRQAQLRKSAYCASKAAAIQLTRCMALDLGEYGIRANAVCPGTVATPMIQQTIDELGTEEIDRRVKGEAGTFRIGIPMGRIAESEDVAATVLFLLSSLSCHVSGQVIGVDGGESAV